MLAAVTARPLVPDRDRGATTVGEYLDRQVEMLQDAHRRGDRLAARLIRATVAREATHDEVLASALTLEVARTAIARDHGYEDWSAAQGHAEEPIDADFETACDAIQWGELDLLRVLLDARPALVHARSPFAHRATLLHHVAANGIEVERQIQSPSGAVDIAALLLARGAEADALCDTYGGGRNQTTLCLLVSSTIPAAAGVQAPLVEELCRGGARADGLDDDGAPLWTAITFGYTEAAEALARCGARVDNLVFAAALGRLDAVQGYFDADGTLLPGPAWGTIRAAPGGSRLDPDRLADYALIWAALHGRRVVVEFLIASHPDLAFTEPFFNSTAYGAARHGRHEEIAALLAAAG
jgi:hypothetical protein